MERAFAELIRRLASDYRIVVVSARLDESLQPLVEWRRVRTPPKPLAVKFPWFFIAGGIRMLTLRADIVHVLGAIVPTRADAACIQFCHAGFIEKQGGLAPPDTPFLRRTNTLVTRWFALQAERWCYRPTRLRTFAAVSNGVARELARHYPDVPVAVTPNGVDVERYRPDRKNRRDLRNREGVTDNDFVALFVGGDWGRKGLAITIDAIAVARQLGAPLRLWVVGRGDVPRYVHLAKRAGVVDSVRFCGPNTATEHYFQAADVFVLPTLYETFSLVAYEAAATGLPIIATAVSGINDLVQENVGGLLVERDAEAVALALFTIWTDNGLAARLGETGRQRARAYTWDDAELAVRSLYNALLTEDARRRWPMMTTPTLRRSMWNHVSQTRRPRLAIARRAWSSVRSKDFLPRRRPRSSGPET
jgi:UDP-glucose:(heptosyl)LPS alpha-1,3-glucosyltransferase